MNKVIDCRSRSRTIVAAGRRFQLMAASFLLAGYGMIQSAEAQAPTPRPPWSQELGRQTVQRVIPPGPAVKWQGWKQLDPTLVTDLGVCVSAEGLGRVFARKAQDGRFYEYYLAPNTGAIPTWSQVPGAPATDVPLAAIKCGAFDEMNIFAKDSDKRIKYNREVYGSYDCPIGQWKGWTEVAGLKTDYALSCGRSFLTLCLYAVSADNHHVYCNKMNLQVTNTNHVWDGWRELPGDFTTDASVTWAQSAAEEAGGNLFAKGRDNHVYWNAGGRGWKEVPGITTTSQVTGGCDGYILYAVARCADGKICIATMLMATLDSMSSAHKALSRWSNWTEVPGGFTTDSPVATYTWASGPHKTGIVLFAKGTDGRIWRNYGVVDR